LALQRAAHHLGYTLNNIPKDSLPRLLEVMHLTRVAEDISKGEISTPVKKETLMKSVT